MIKIDINLVFTIINLIVLYLLMKKFLFGPIIGVMEKRKAMIDEQFASAEKTTTEANQLKGQYEDALKSAKEESFSIVEQAKDEAKVQADSIVKRANDQAGQILEKARRDISTEQEAAMKAMEGKVAELAMDAIREQKLKADIIYACGPTPMLRAIKQYAEENGIECYISLEERMACGIGACLACVCKSKEKDAHSNVKNKRICKDGPVFLSTEVEI